MTNHFVFGGALPEESPDYVKRDADDQLFSALEDRKFCYVLNSRQTGKSSLSVQTRKRLREAGIYYFYYDISKQGKSAKDTDEWYQDQINAIIRSALINYKIYLLDINENIELDKVSPKLKEWWESRSGSSLGKYEDFIEGHLLQNIKGNIVFIFDEIDSVMNLLFPTEDFFGFIRGCHEDRRDKKQYERLTFCLMGVASPNNLIADKDRTPFNIGTAINLRPFPTDLTDRNSRDTMKPLLNNAWVDINLLQEILNQTGGQPFLTHKLWCLVVEERKADRFTTIEEFVNSKIIDRWKEQDLPSHLTTIQDRFKESQHTFLLLDLYQKILKSKNMLLKVDDDREQLELELKLSGLVLQENGFLKPYNLIYTRIFNLNWVETEREKLRLYIEEFENWKKADPRQKERYLLYGDKGEQVQQWRENFQEPLYETEARFLDQSEEFWRRVQIFFPNLLDNKKIIEKIIQSTNHWTGGFKLFNNIIFEKAAETDNLVGLQQDKVQGWLENLVLRNLNFFEKYYQFQKDRDQFSNQEDTSIDSFALISTFEQIAQKEPVPFDENNPQHRKLKAMCFIILDQDNKLRILNKIYEELLNQDWIKSVIEQIRPYTKPFREWKDSGQSHDYVLQNNDLKLALKWLGKKPTPKLELLEIEFVITSLVAEVWATALPSVQSKATKLVIEFRRSLQGKNNYSDFLLQEILQWTRPEPLLLNELLEVVNKTEISATNYHDWIKQLKTPLAEHFRLIEQGLTNNHSCESFWLIVKYRQILLQGKIEFDETRENTKLIELGLVIKIDQQLEIANLIYKNIFDPSWTYQKLSEYKRIRAINLLKWCRANNPEQNDPVLRSYLDEWIKNNSTVVEKIVRDAQGEVPHNEFNFIDEIKLLTYDIVKMDFVEDSQIQLCLDRTFDKETKKMKQDNLDKLLSAIVEEGSAIEAVAIVNLEEGGLEYHNKELETSKPEIYQALFGQRDASEALADFADLKGIPTALKTFGAATKYGALEYSMFYLDKGIVLVDFLDLPEVTVAICFIATTEANFTKLVRQYRNRINELKSELQKALG